MLKKILIACLALAFVFAGFAATGFYLLPKVATDKLPALLSEQTGQTVTLQAVEFNPFDVTAALHGLSISKPGGAALLS